MKSDLTIQEVRNEKTRLTERITQALKDFHDVTDIYVSGEFKWVNLRQMGGLVQASTHEPVVEIYPITI